MDISKETVTEESAEVAPVSPAALVQIPISAPRVDEWRRVQKLALRQLDRFISCEPKVLRGDDSDAIHDMRVASRRLQQLLDLIYPPPRPREVSRLRRRIRRCRLALGNVRNCDVLLGIVESALKRKRVSHRDAWVAVRDYLLARRPEFFWKALRKFGKVNLAVLYVDLKAHLALLGPASPPNHHHSIHPAPVLPVLEPFPERVARTLEGVWNAFEEKAALSEGDRGAPIIHAVRIAAKRLRYLLEVVHEFEVAGSAEAVASLRRLQQHLGDWHDLEVLEQMMIDLIARPDYLRENLPLAMEVERLVLRTRQHKKRLEQKYFQMIQDPSERQRLKDWVGYLLASPSAAFANA